MPLTLIKCRVPVNMAVSHMQLEGSAHEKLQIFFMSVKDHTDDNAGKIMELM